MKIVIASDSFKGTMSSKEIGNIIAQTLEYMNSVNDDHERKFQTVVIPISDGGEGVIETFISSLNGELIETSISDPLGRVIKGSYLLNNNLAIIESAVACGLPLIQEQERNPLYTSSYGVGQLIKHALDHGATEFIIGIGGSSTNDCGTGMLESLGMQYYDENDKPLIFMTGEKLGKVHRIDDSELDCRLGKTAFRVMCDVDNVLLGPNGATYTFAPQKGANKKICDLLEANMEHYVEKVKEHSNNCGKLSLDNIIGGGAAGGLGSCLSYFLSAKLEQGIDLILDVLEFDRVLDNCNLVITGEGKMDAQTLYGKVPLGVLKRAQGLNIKTIAICGILENEEKLSKLGFDALIPIVPKIATSEDSMREPRKALKKLVETEVYQLVMNNNKIQS